MFVKVTEGIEITVKTQFEAECSVPFSDFNWFTYFINIVNQSEHEVQLLRRNWHIYDAFLKSQEVEGEGVVGETPIIAPGASHSYYSHVNLRTESGFMEGTYLMQRTMDGYEFYVDIPRFILEVPFKRN